jgi:multidrug resistance efflux pump
MKPIVKILTTSTIVLAALGMIAYKYLDYIKYPWTRDGLVRAQVVQIVPRVSGPLVSVPIQNNQLVVQGELLFEIDPRPFQAAVNFASANLANMRDIVKALADQAEAMKGNVAQSKSALRQAKFDADGNAANTENARIEFERAKELLATGTGTQANFDNKYAAYQMAVAQLSGAKAQVNQTTAELARAKDDLARATANLGAVGEDNPRLRRAEADLETAQLNLDFTKVWSPTIGYVTNLQLRVGDSAVANQPIMAVIDLTSFYVEAFFRETFVGNFKKGDRAVVTLMSYPNTPWRAKSIASAGALPSKTAAQVFSYCPPFAQPSNGSDSRSAYR